MLDTKINTQEIAKKLLERNLLSEPPQYSWKEIFEIRDACLILAKYGLHDQDLLGEVLRYIGNLVGE